MPAQAQPPADALPEDSPALRARALYFAHWSPAEIAARLGVEQTQVAAWKKAGKWDEINSVDVLEQAFQVRLLSIIGKDHKGNNDYAEIDSLTRQLERLARIRQYNDTGKESALNPKRLHGPLAPRKKKLAPGGFSEPQIKAVEEAFLSDLFAYQRRWHSAAAEHRIVNILKSRQIGATRFFARRALVDALKTGKNKIFLSASKAQAYQFRAYILELAREAADAELKGDPLRVRNIESNTEALLYFLGTNARTAQSYHGDVIMDEYFWIPRFEQFRTVASGMAMHKKWSQVYLSTPSAITAEAYPFWTGQHFNRRRKRADRAEFPTDPVILKEGAYCPDGQWRQLIDVYDAIAGGCNLFDIEQLKLEYSEDQFNNLLLCQFMDDRISAFPFDLLQKCLVDTWEVWEDYKPFAARPLGDSPVWIGYDPAGDTDRSDGCGLVALAPPAALGGPHRIMERHKLRGQDYEKQAETVLSMLARYRVQHIGIDVTGIGNAVAKIVEVKHPITRYQYNPALKSAMVLQCAHVMSKGRLQYDSGWTDLTSSFLAIRKEFTAGGRMTFQGGRSVETGHAELAWAVMHALHHEPIEAPVHGASTAKLEIF